MIEQNTNSMYIRTDKFNHYSIVPVAENPTEHAIKEECDSLTKLLIEKNRSYGNSALDPVRIFSTSDNVEQLRVRIDDKLSRFVRGTDHMGDNDIDDLMGYLILLKIAMKGNWR